MLEPGSALDLVGRLLALALCLHALEDIRLARFWQHDSRWAQPLSLHPSLEPCQIRVRLDHRGLLVLCAIRLCLAPLAAWYGLWPCWLALFASNLSISIRWGGSFNGGSDAMALQLLLAMTIHAGFGSTIEGLDAVIVLYIGVQVIASYMVSGLIKLRSAAWRRARAIPWFLRHSATVEGVRLGRWLANRRPLCFGLSLGVLAFECGSPLALRSPTLCAGFMVFGGIFHLANARFLGLNRFLHLWLAGYPALYASACLLTG